MLSSYKSAATTLAGDRLGAAGAVEGADAFAAIFDAQFTHGWVGVSAALRPGVQAPSKASARAAAQLPYRSMTVDDAGHSPACSRFSASPPRRRACVRDQSHEDGAVP